MPVKSMPDPSHPVPPTQATVGKGSMAALGVLLPVCPPPPPPVSPLPTTTAPARDALEGGEVPPPPSLQGVQPTPDHCLPDGKRQLRWHL